jgi:putative adenylate-forming enzyme
MNPALLARIFRRRAELRSHDRWTRQQLEHHQAAALRELREFALARSHFYQRFHRSFENRPLQELPVLTKATLMEVFDELATAPDVRRSEVESHLTTMESTDRLHGRYFVAATSGSTGRRGFFVWDDREWATVMASYARSQDWAGVPAKLTRRMKMAVVSSKTPWHQSAVVGATAHSPFVPTLRLDSKEPVDKLDAELDAFGPEVLVGYASMMRLLADEQLGGRLHIAPKAIFSASEVLSGESRRRIEQAFGTVPYNVYAATETAGIASDCERHRMHLFEDLVITEIVDDRNRPVPPGQFGAKVLVTVLFSRTLPLIRYEMSDCPRPSAEVCACGRPFALIDGIEGRREDVLELSASDAGGTVSVHPNTFHDVLDLVPARGWQVVAEPSQLRVLMAGLPTEYDRAGLVQKLNAALRARGTSPRILVEDVHEIPRSALGKAPLIRRASA